jgi:hypothetical protein
LIRHQNLAGTAGAWLSEDGRYRHLLWRRWSHAPKTCFVMLNPSTADHAVDDPTIRRCISFARQSGGLNVINLSPFRATDPRDLYREVELHGVPPLECLDALEDSAEVLVAWGALSGASPAVRIRLRQEAEKILERARMRSLPILCLGANKDGSPKHPLYLPSGADRVPWP